MELSGKSAIVTGGAGGLGAATVRHLAGLGVGVVVADLAVDAAEALAGIAKSKGIDISAEQIKAQMTASKAGPDDELDDAALEAVSGGGSPYCMSTKGCYCMCTGMFTENWF